VADQDQGQPALAPQRVEQADDLVPGVLVQVAGRLVGQQDLRFLDQGPGDGAARFAWNWGLAKCTERYGAEDKWYSAAELHKLWNAQKKADPALAWWAENSKCAYQEAFRDLHRALREFMRSKRGERKGRQLGFPKFKKRGRGKDSFRFGAGVIRCAGTTVTLPLNVTGMTRNRRLARAVYDQGFGQARRMLAYKTAWSGGQLVVAGRFYPSSKTCSACGWRKPSLTLAERTFACEACGLVLDRDQNAARNLLGLAASGAESENACGGTVRPSPAGRVSANQEPGTAHKGKTGTVPRQHGTAA
jgi:transposase